MSPIWSLYAWIKADRQNERAFQESHMRVHALSGVNYFFPSTTIKIAAQRQLPLFSGSSLFVLLSACGLGRRACGTFAVLGLLGLFRMGRRSCRGISPVGRF